MEENNINVQQAVNEALSEQKKKKKKKVLIVFAIIVLLIIIASVASGGGSDNSAQNTAQNASVSDTTAVSAEKEKEQEGKIGDYICTIKSAKICRNWEGKDSVKITYAFTNNSSEPMSFDIALSDELYQDGIGLESTFISSEDEDWGIDVKIKPSTTKEVSKVYILRDKTTAVDVEISEYISFSDDKLTYKVELQ